MFAVAILRLIQDLKPKVQSSHWSLNGLAAHKFTNVSLLQALSVTHNYDFICLSEIFLDRLFQMKVKELILKVTIFCGPTIQVTKKGGVCILLYGTPSYFSKRWFMYLKVGLSPLFLFTSMKALQRWWKMLFISC